MKINLEERYTYGTLLSVWIRLQKNYPGLITIFSIGQSHDNRELICIRFGKGSVGSVMLGGLHGRECVNPIVLTAIIGDYCEKYYSYVPEYKRFDSECIYFIPLLNPDGYEVANSGVSALKHSAFRTEFEKRKNISCEYKGNARGIDLNRNFYSKNFVANQDSGTPFCENETKAFRNFCFSHPTTGLIDFHSRGETVYYYRGAMQEEYNQRQRYLAECIGIMTGYALHMPEEENIDGVSGGNSVNYYSETFQKPALTIETVPESAQFPLDVKYQKLVYEQIRDVPLKIRF